MFMDAKEFIRKYIKKILLEEEEKSTGELPKTTGPGPGRFSKAVKGMKALADENPAKLMANLKASPGGGDPGDVLMGLLRSAASGTPEMSAAYAAGRTKKDAYGRVGATVSVTGDLPLRDALMFMRETVTGATNAGYLSFDEPVQVEILGGDIIAYTSRKPFAWNKPKPPEKKKPKPPEKKK